MKIKKLILKNYKVFDHLELDFTDKNGQVLDTIVLAGLNGTGKTTILELLTDLMNGEFNQNILGDIGEITLEVLLPLKYIIPTRKKINNIGEDYFPITTFSDTEKLMIIYIAQPKDYKLRNKAVWGIYNLSKDFAEILSTNNKFNRKNGLLISPEIQPDKNDLDKILSNIYRTSLFTGKNHIKNTVLQDIKKQILDNIDITPRESSAREINSLNEIFKYLNIQSKLYRVSNKDLIFKSISGQEITFDDLSTGEKTLYFMGFCAKSWNINDGVIMIDQPEDSLHPKWQQQITKFFQSVGENNQVILATHSPQIIASVHPESVFVLGVNEETGKIEAFNMATEHKHSFGVEPNRILDEIMGTPVRTLDQQERINHLVEMIKRVEFNKLDTTIQDVEQAIVLLEEDYGKQDATVMRFRNEVRFLKRKALVAK
jgi:predicted ATP-binding protein involved in virulence